MFQTQSPAVLDIVVIKKAHIPLGKRENARFYGSLVATSQRMGCAFIAGEKGKRSNCNVVDNSGITVIRELESSCSGNTQPKIEMVPTLDNTAVISFALNGNNLLISSLKHYDVITLGDMKKTCVSTEVFCTHFLRAKTSPLLCASSNPLLLVIIG